MGLVEIGTYVLMAAGFLAVLLVLVLAFLAVRALQTGAGERDGGAFRSAWLTLTSFLAAPPTAPRSAAAKSGRSRRRG